MSAQMSLWRGIGAVVMALGLPAAAFAAGSTNCQPTTCSAAPATCQNSPTAGVDDCGNSCSNYFDNYCTALEPTCAKRTTTGTYVCGGSCTKTMDNYCTAADPACGEMTAGTYVCGGSCTKTGGACDTRVPYGYAIPGDPVYGYGLPDNKTMDMLALAAKGNVILGDYTSPDFQNLVAPKLGPGVDSLMQPYAIDPTDKSLGYHDDGFTAKGLPRFSGNYDQWDGGYKRDTLGNIVGDRKFYESSLPDDKFKALLADNWKSELDPQWSEVDAVMFTNHLFAGYAPQQNIYLFGSMVARDDAFMFRNGFWSDHDTRLSGTGGSIGIGLPSNVGLPMSVGRPTLQSWKECAPAGC